MSARTYRAPRRPAPRRQSRTGDPISSIDWERLGRIALTFVLFVILALYVRPVANLAGEWTSARSDTARMQSLEGENARLKRRVAGLRSAHVLEREARKIGMVRKGERAYVVRGLGSRR